jgi:hypothetical protein
MKGRLVKQCIGKNVKGSGRGLSWGNPFIFLKGLSGITIAGLLSKVLTLDLLKTKQDCYQPDRDLGHRLSWCCVLGLLRHVDLDGVPYVSEVYNASIFRVQAC